MPSAEVRMLGTLRVRAVDGSLVGDRAWKTVKTQDLLRILVLADGKPVPVERLVDLLWPDADLAHGRASLRTAACQLRKVLGQGTIERRGESLVLQGVRSDVSAHRALVADADRARRWGQPAEQVALTRKAEAMYGGDLDVSGQSCDWLYAARDGLSELRVQSLVDAAEAAADCRWLRESLEFARRADEIRPGEASARALMRAWGGLGETAKAVEVFERVRRRLAEHYGVDPSPQTRAVYLQLVTAGLQCPPICPGAAHDRVVDRLVLVAQRLCARPDAAGVVWLLGVPGSGRSTVAARAGQRVSGTVTVLADPVRPTPEGVGELHERARHDRAVLVALVNQETVPASLAGESTVVVPRLDLDGLRTLLTFVLQCPPTPRLERSLWTRSGGLAGVAVRWAVEQVRHDRLVWTPDGLDVAENDPDGVPAPTRVATVPAEWAAV